MPSGNKCINFGAGQDKMGKNVTIHYKGKASYGTAVGGYVSLCVRFLILILAVGQIWACFFRVKYYENEAMTQLDVPNKVVYNITYQNGFPSFSIYSPTSGSIEDPFNVEGDYNNRTMFDFAFYLRYASAEGVR